MSASQQGASGSVIHSDAFFRVGRHVKAKVQVLAAAGHAPPRVENEPTAGVILTCDEAYPPNTHVQVALRAHGVDVHYSVRGEVVWTLSNPLLHASECGIRLIGLSERQRENARVLFGERNDPDRRRFLRLKHALSLELRPQGGLLRRRWLGTTTDVSLGGLAACGSRPWRGKAGVAVRFLLPAESDAFEAKGTVLDHHTMPDGRCLLRVTFAAVEQAQLQRLVAFFNTELTRPEPG